MIAEIKAQETRRRLATSTGAGSGSGSGYARVSKVAEERMPHVNDNCLSVVVESNDAIADAADAVAVQAEYKEIFDIHACHPLGMVSHTCSYYYYEEYNSFTKSGQSGIEKWIMHIDAFAANYKESMSQMQDDRNMIHQIDATVGKVDMMPPASNLAPGAAASPRRTTLASPRCAPGRLLPRSPGRMAF